MKVLISGGGIAGNALAFWLSKLGHAVTVIERFPTLRATGLQVDLRGHGIEVMKRMGLEQSFRSKLAPEQGLQVVDSSGRRRAFFPRNKSRKGPQNFTTEYEIMRGDLCQLMYDETKSRVKYIFSKSIEGFEEKGSFVEVRFADGETDRFDLLVGADGQWSHTRRMMLGPDKPDTLFPLEGGKVYVAYFTIPRPIQEGEEYIATMYQATKKRGVLMRRHSPDKVQIYLGGTTASERLKNARRGDMKEEKDALAEVCQGAGWQVDEILKSMVDADDFYCERMGVVKMDSWSRSRITLVGDAGYCPSAKTGMGTTSAMVGAYILAGEIGRHCGGDNTKDNLASALEGYERKFRPFMDQVQKGILEDSGWDMMPTTEFGIAVLNYLMGLASFLKINLGNWILRENVKDWDLPDYKEMQS